MVARFIPQELRTLLEKLDPLLLHPGDLASFDHDAVERAQHILAAAALASKVSGVTGRSFKLVVGSVRRLLVDRVTAEPHPYLTTLIGLESLASADGVVFSLETVLSLISNLLHVWEFQYAEQQKRIAELENNLIDARAAVVELKKRAGSKASIA